MRHGRGRRAAVAGGLVVFALGLFVAPAYAAPPTTVPTVDPVAPDPASGIVTVSASSEAAFVQFYADGTAVGSPVPGTGTPGNPQPVSAQWSSWSWANGTRMLTAADCNADGCNAQQSQAVSVNLFNVQPAFSAPADAAVVWGDVAVTATSTAPKVHLLLDGVPFGGAIAPDINGRVSITWTTWSVSNGLHHWTVENCDDQGCDATDAPMVAVTVANATITAPTDTATVSGDVSVTATSAAPKVRFFLDGASFGDPVPVAAGGGSVGSASVTWTTWSLPDGAHTWTVSNCDNTCDATSSAPVHVTLDNTSPTFTAPAGNPPPPVSGVVTVTAMTNAPKVRFYRGGSGAPVPFGQSLPTSNGRASVQWNSYGSLNRDYTWSAAACDANGVCNPTQSSLILTLRNPAPAVTSPADHATVGTTVTINASAPGGGLAFFVDGSKASFDGSAPYSFTTPSALTYGVHHAWVQECNAAGTMCSGPVSPTITFTVSKLSPSIKWVSPATFSPGTDGSFDRTSFRVHLPDAEHVSFRIANGDGQTIQGPHAPSGTIGPGDRVFTWDGRNNAGKFVGDGAYTIVVDTSSTTGGVTLRGTATADVRVDHSAPAFSKMTGNRSTTYPVVDGYLDTFRPSVHVSEGGSLWLEITTTTGSRVRLLAQPHASSGTFTFSWNGRDAAGRRVRAGNYHYRFMAMDRVGNRGISRTLAVRVSYQHTVRAGALRMRNGNLGRTSATNSYCTQYSLGFSNFAHGLWLDNSCDRGFDGNQFIYADYTMAVPGAVRYESISVRVFGETTHAPEPISAYVYDFTHGNWDLAGTATLTRNAKPARTTFGPISGVHHVSLRHRVRVRIAVPDKVTPEDYDIASVSMSIRYDVLSRPTR
jgi:flagellar hook assembly protein FlgD